MIYGVLAAVIAGLVLKIVMLRKSAREIREGFEYRMKTDTNSVISISGHDREMRALASAVNEQLIKLREEYNRYSRGNSELTGAVTGISHDIRTPLTAISGYLELIRKTDDPEKIKRYLEIIAERTEAMRQLTEELFRYSVMMTEEKAPELRDTDLGQAIEDCVMGCYGALRERGIEPEIDLPEERVIRKADGGDLARVLSNLVSNALKYSAGDLVIRLTADGVMTFSNAAPRLDHVQAEQLFDRFYTVDNARSSTGLGLSIARSLTERMGGRIFAEIEDGRLTVTLELKE